MEKQVMWLVFVGSGLGLGVCFACVAAWSLAKQRRARAFAMTDTGEGYREEEMCCVREEETYGEEEAAIMLEARAEP